MPSSQYTKKIFAQSLKELMEKMPFEAISVGDIAANCEMSRNTFYYHFRDKYELVNWIFRTESAQYFSVTPNLENWSGLIHGLCDYFRANRAFYSNALAYNGQNSLRDYLFDTIKGITAQHLHAVVTESGEKLSERDIDFASDFFAVTTVGLFARWTQRGMKEDAEMYHDCLSRILSGALLAEYLHSEGEQGK